MNLLYPLTWSCSYPSQPNPGSLKPIGPPKDGNGNPLTTDVGVDDAGDDNDLLGTTESPPDDQTIQGFAIPGCPDRVSSLDAASASASMASAGPSSSYTSSVSSSSTAPAATAVPSCDTTALSGVPYNVFSGSAGNIYDKFCANVTSNQQNKLDTVVDSSGNPKAAAAPSRRFRRTPPPDPSAYASYSFELDWEPNTSNSQCTLSCSDAYNHIANGNCGQQGGEQNTLTASASLDVACGTYSYKITGSDVPAAQAPAAPSLSAQYCIPIDDFGDHGDVQEDWVEEYSGYACAGTADKTIKDDPATTIHWNTQTNGVPYNYTISWTPGCKSSVTEQNVWQPLADNTGLTCSSMLVNDYKNCK